MLLCIKDLSSCGSDVLHRHPGPLPPGDRRGLRSLQGDCPATSDVSVGAHAGPVSAQFEPTQISNALHQCIVISTSPGTQGFLWVKWVMFKYSALQLQFLSHSTVLLRTMQHPRCYSKRMANSLPGPLQPWATRPHPVIFPNEIQVSEA